MAKFTVRVELKEATSSDHEDLYEKMKLEGFSKFITTSKGDKYELPPAEYNFSSSTKSKGEVRDLVYKIAKSINSEPAVLVTESNGRSWIGLDDA